MSSNRKNGRSAARGAALPNRPAGQTTEPLDAKTVSYALVYTKGRPSSLERSLREHPEIEIAFGHLQK
jgi:hypothetical protein